MLNLAFAKTKEGSAKGYSIQLITWALKLTAGIFTRTLEAILALPLYLQKNLAQTLTASSLLSAPEAALEGKYLES